MRKLLLNIHLYGGLITFWYLLIYGWTSLGFNHKWMLPEADAAAAPLVWQRPVPALAETDNVKLAGLVRNELGLFGWPLPWAMQRTSGGALEFELARPGRRYKIAYNPAASSARVEERDTGLGSVLHFLHGSGSGVPNSSWSGTWPVYTEITNWVVLFSLVSGAILWVQRRRGAPTALLLLALGGVISAGLFFYVWRVG